MDVFNGYSYGDTHLANTAPTIAEMVSGPSSDMEINPYFTQTPFE
jgi:hypothetical protein